MNQQGGVVAEASSAYEIDSRAPGFSEQHPEYWKDACEEVLTRLSREVPSFGAELEAISFSGQMHSLVVLDEAFRPVYPAILWNDVRTTRQCQEITERFGKQILEITKNRVLEGFTLPKILWLQENEADIWNKVRHIMLPKDYLAFVLTGELHTDFSDAAGTLLFDVRKADWSDEICDEFGIDQGLLPPISSSFGQVGTVKESYRILFDFKHAVKVYAGGADNACAAFGAGLVNEEDALVSMGTSGVFSSFEQGISNYQGKLHFFNHVLPEVNYSMGVTLAAGNSLNWFKKAFGNEMTFDEMLRDMNTVAPGSEGLLFTPYIMGERTPYFDSEVRGSFIGIDAHHEMKHFARAVLEGITFSLRDSQILMEEVKNKRFKRIISIGGGAKNLDWMQIQADIFNAKIVRLEMEQGPGVGACMIAAVGCGWFESPEACREMFVHYKEGEIAPIAKNVERYLQLYKIYCEVYPATKELSRALLDRK